MKWISAITRVFVLVMMVLIALFTIGCEHFTAITYENKTISPVNIIIYKVSLGTTVIPKRTWNQPGDVINAGESKTLLTDVPNTRNGGVHYNYAVIGVTETNQIVISKIYTWDELYNANWTVVINAPP